MLQESSDDDASSPAKLNTEASRAFEAREKRLTVGALQLDKEVSLADAEVSVVAEKREWRGDLDSDWGSLWSMDRS